jgi:hypothetical protein
MHVMADRLVQATNCLGWQRHGQGSLAAQFQKDRCSVHVMASRLVQAANCLGRQDHGQG